jgi:uncharacterized protein (TIGR02271 family)
MSDEEHQVIPLLREELEVTKETRETGRVRVRTVTKEYEELIDEMLARDEVQVEKVIINQQIDAIPPVREEGDTIVVPVVEEILVVERRLMLKEEIIVRRMHRTERYQEKVKLRRQEAEVTRLPVDESR